MLASSPYSLADGIGAGMVVPHSVYNRRADCFGLSRTTCPAGLPVNLRLRSRQPIPRSAGAVSVARAAVVSRRPTAFQRTIDDQQRDVDHRSGRIWRRCASMPVEGAPAAHSQRGEPQPHPPFVDVDRVEELPVPSHHVLVLRVERIQRRLEELHEAGDAADVVPAGTAARRRRTPGSRDRARHRRPIR